MSRRILTVNGGSSSIKFALFEAGGSLTRVLQGAVERVGLPEARLRVEALPPGGSFSRGIRASDHAEAAQALMDWVEGELGQATLAGVGHRVVHGGPDYGQAALITPAMVQALHRLEPFDPEHLPEETLLTEAFHRRFPTLPQVACFDTEFHWRLPPAARLLPLPRRFEAEGVRRYGFHGLSYAFLLEEFARQAGGKAARGRLILAHLGNGASLAAVKGGQPVDTTMGMTPAGGIPMGTRSGDLDPGLVWYLSAKHGLGPKAWNHLVNFESGLRGISETTSDMRELLDREGADPRAAEAVGAFVYQVKKTIGAYAAALGGVDAVIFSGGIGERSAPIRARVCQGLEFLGLEVDPGRNDSGAAVISTAASRVAARVIPTDEEWMIAKTACRLLGISPGKDDYHGRNITEK